MRLLPSKRAHLYVLERSRVYTRDKRVEYISDEGKEPRAFNIPVANTSFILLGPGCSITNEAVRHLKQEGVCIGFCGGGGTPLLSADDPYPDLMGAIDEYRPPEYLHRWFELWRDEQRRLEAARTLLLARLEQIGRCWPSIDFGVMSPQPPSEKAQHQFRAKIASAKTTQELLGAEGNFAQKLYAAVREPLGFSDFTRQPRSSTNLTDPNTLLDRGNYLAYGLASVVLWTLGIPSSLSVLHGKTRRGGLVFDLADVIKDALILPTAFANAARARKESVTGADFRAACLAAFDDAKALDVLFTTMMGLLD
jgi:CRISPR-associated protein Cas1